MSAGCPAAVASTSGSRSGRRSACRPVRARKAAEEQAPEHAAADGPAGQARQRHRQFPTRLMVPPSESNASSQASVRNGDSPA